MQRNANTGNANLVADGPIGDDFGLENHVDLLGSSDDWRWRLHPDGDFCRDHHLGVSDHLRCAATEWYSDSSMDLDNSVDFAAGSRSDIRNPLPRKSIAIMSRFGLRASK